MAFVNTARGKFDPVITVGIGIVNILAACGIVYGLNFGFSLTAWLLAVFQHMLPMLGVTLMYHRFYTHNSYQCSRRFQLFWTLWAGQSGQGRTDTWCRYHHQHHAFTDKPGDPHSPHTYSGFRGFWWAHMGWLFYKTERPAGYAPKFKWENDPFVLWQIKWNWLLMVSGLVLPGLITLWADGNFWPGFWLAGAIRAALSWQMAGCVNSVCHLWGWQPPGADAGDNSVNNELVSFGAAGEGSHYNHHQKPNCAYLGWRWYDFDPGKWVLKLAGRCGMVWDVRTPTGFDFYRKAVVVAGVPAVMKKTP